MTAAQIAFLAALQLAVNGLPGAWPWLALLEARIDRALALEPN
jgi:hypothetical protein